MNARRQQEGFTLIEILVTVVIMGILGVLIVQTFITTITTNVKTELMKDIKQNGDFAVDVISRKVRNAKTLDCSTSTSITVTNPDNTTSRFFAEENSNSCRLSQQDTPGITTYISSSNLTLDPTGGICANSFKVITCEPIASQDARVTFSFTLFQNNPSLTLKNYEKASQLFKTTVSLRNVQY